MRTFKPLLIVAAVLAGVALAPRAASAYPQFQLSTGAQRCNQCHIGPAGGTLLSGYGRDEAGDTISRGGNGAFLHGLWDPPDWLQLGGDARLALLVSDNGGPGQPAVHAFPMQGDLYASIHASDFYAVGVLGARGTVRGFQNSDALEDKLSSREHYLMWRPAAQGAYVRAGRFQLPYGLRLVEHPLYVRRWGGQNYNEEPYALSGGVVKNEYEWHLTAHVKNPFRCTGQACATYGGVAYYERRVGDKLVLGAEARAAFFDKTDYGYDTYHAGFVAKYWLEGPKLLFMAQGDFGLKKIEKAHYTNRELVSYLGVSYFPVRGILVTAAAESWYEDLQTKGSERHAGSLEVQYFPWAHFELLLWGRMSTDASLLMTQLHYYL